MQGWPGFKWQIFVFEAFTKPLKKKVLFPKEIASELKGSLKKGRIRWVEVCQTREVAILDPLKG